MKNLKPITQNPKTVFNDIISSKKADKKSGIDRKLDLIFIKEVVFSRFEEYEKNKINLENLSDSIFLYDKDKDNLIHCYENPTKSSDSLMKCIKDNQENNLKGTCQYCGISEPSSIDHYLPKSLYPEFSVYTLNLIPCCADCNRLKGNVFKKKGIRHIINFYYDDVDAVQFLFCNIKMDDKIPLIEFELRIVTNSNDFLKTVSYHFEKLELLDRYKKCANSVVTEITNALISNSSIDLKMIREHLIKEAELNKIYFGKNHWRTILKESLANSDDFMRSIYEI